MTATTAIRRQVRRFLRWVGIGVRSRFAPGSKPRVLMARLARRLPAACRESVDTGVVAQAVFEFAQRHAGGAYFVQIGANDGVTRDPIGMYVRRDRWSGLMVEPVREVHERLVRNYSDLPGIRFERAAVAASDGEQEFYRLAPTAGDRKTYDALGSLNRDVVKKHIRKYPELQERFDVIAVPTITVATLFAKHGVGAVDVLCVDTEGHDFQVLEQFPWTRLRPELVIYEHQHLSAEDRTAAESLLKGHGYRLHREAPDTVARLQDGAGTDAVIVPPTG